MQETEITVQVFNDLKEIDEILKSKSFEMVENYQINDWYFTNIKDIYDLDYLTLINNSFLVRQIVDENPHSELVYKLKELDEFGNVIKEEKTKSKILDLNSALAIFRNANLNNWCELTNDSYIYRNGDVEFAVQVIKDLGIFIEYEEDLSMAEFSAVQKFNIMSDFVRTLGLKLGEDYSCKKVYLKAQAENKLRDTSFTASKKC